MKALPLIGLFLSTAAAAGSFDACKQHFYRGFVPTPLKAPTSQRALCFDGFAVLHSGQSKTPVYVAEHLTRESIADAKDEERTNRFYAEARLPESERATLKDYEKSGYDRGHMFPAGDAPNPTVMAQSFSLANMVPQAPKMNRGVWKRSVEMATRKYVERSGEAYVITGPLYQAPVATIGRQAVWIPTALFKLVYDPAKNKAWAYVLSNTDDARMTAPVSYQALVKMTGYPLLPSSPD